ncbi:alpha-(1,3)-fucosyltransferase C [Topomyia yanbarensis]|uniref:alpha-(1,3)-fucosyltransferase C n=1 Tax=Topomyia yanbarensis TaxID=2498891 RepID=UPI00273AABC2|nr:alpha-(1,3)-fucosyltransferase C [Topomyia yanbarensis]
MIRRMKRARFVLYLSIGTVSLLLLVILFVHTQCLRPSISYYQILEESIQNRRPDDRKYILLYTNFFGNRNWYLRAETVGPDFFKSIQCPVTDCVLTNNRELLNGVSDYDALLFHIAEPWTYSLFEKVPKIRSPRQIYVAANMESPAHTKHLLEGDHDFFNWTMTYRLDSDIIWNYNYFVEIDTGYIVGPADRPQWRTGWENYFNETLLELVQGKTKMGVQFVSHCGAFSRRDELVREIQRLMEVDVYGKCGTMECPRGSPRCAQMLTEEYHFYFAFENSLCRDYITEKMYNSMDSYIIPVVFGGADYTKFAPPRSYIDVQQFKTVHQLVDYLDYLARNPREYIKYFWWKEHYRISGDQPFCQLCRKLHEIGAQERTQYYRNIKQWWFDGACERDARIKF